MDFVLTAEALVRRHQWSSGLEPSSFYFIEETRWITAWISVYGDGFLIGQVHVRKCMQFMHWTVGLDNTLATPTAIAFFYVMFVWTIHLLLLQLLRYVSFLWTIHFLLLLLRRSFTCYLSEQYTCYSYCYCVLLCGVCLNNTLPTPTATAFFYGLFEQYTSYSCCYCALFCAICLNYTLPTATAFFSVLFFWTIHLLLLLRSFMCYLSEQHTSYSYCYCVLFALFLQTCSV